MEYYLNEVNEMLEYAKKIFPSPDPSWSEDRIKKRNYQIFGYEKFISRCYKYITTDPLDVAFDYLLYLDLIRDREPDDSIYRIIIDNVEYSIIRIIPTLITTRGCLDIRKGENKK